MRKDEWPCRLFHTRSAATEKALLLTSFSCLQPRTPPPSPSTLLSATIISKLIRCLPHCDLALTSTSDKARDGFSGVFQSTTSHPHPELHFGRYGKVHCLLNDPRTVGLLQLSAVRHVGCESEEASTRSELRRANHNKYQTLRPRNSDPCRLTLVAGQAPNTVQARCHRLHGFYQARTELFDWRHQVPFTSSSRQVIHVPAT